jgi:hypothetical protein
MRLINGAAEKQAIIKTTIINSNPIFTYLSNTVFELIIVVFISARFSAAPCTSRERRLIIYVAVIRPNVNEECDSVRL